MRFIKPAGINGGEVTVACVMRRGKARVEAEPGAGALTAAYSLRKNNHNPSYKSSVCVMLD